MSSSSKSIASSSAVSTLPKYCRQRSKSRADRAYVRIDGQKIMLGPYGSEESHSLYAELIGRAQSAASPPIEESATPTVSEVLAAYLEFAQTYYRRPKGEVSREYGSIHEVAKLLRREDGGERAENFGPKRLKTIREGMIAAGWTRKFINNQVDRIRRIFRWAAGEEMIPPSVPHALSMLAGLRKGRSMAKESTPVLPVADTDVAATLEHLPQVVADMVAVQRLTGMRPGELVIMRPCDIDRSGAVWIYKPATHKTSHHGHDRAIAIGPRCQAILLGYLARGSEDYLFQPRDSESKRRAVMTEARVVPLSCGNTPGSARLDSPQWQPGEAYTVDSYRRAITRAAKKAGVERWTPHRLRHTAATMIRKDFGLEHAQVVLGHSNAQITEVYAERDLEKAAEVALRVG